MSRQLIKGIDTERIKRSLIENCGELTFAAEELGCTYEQLEAAIAKSKKLKESCRIGRESLLDAAERCIFNAMKNGSASMAKFVLQNLGMGRGWLPDNPSAQVQVNVAPPSEQAKRVRAIFGLPEDEQRKLEDK